MASKPKVRLRTKKNPDGSQQYVRGKTRLERGSTASSGVAAADKAVQAMRGDLSEAAFKKRRMLLRAQELLIKTQTEEYKTKP